MAHGLQHGLRLVAPACYGQEGWALVQQEQAKHKEHGRRYGAHPQQPAPVEMFQRGVIHHQEHGAVDLPEDEEALRDALHPDPPVRRRDLGPQCAPSWLAQAKSSAHKESHNRQCCTVHRHGAEDAEEEDAAEGGQDQLPPPVGVRDGPAREVAHGDAHEDKRNHKALLQGTHAPLLGHRIGHGADEQQLRAISKVHTTADQASTHLCQTESKTFDHLGQ
mmetsp:Transcript_25610/g.70409  ORF Transcript_25610/g.70409 Transcript_25610/m.70409 type:complete len:220 (-) Transcript_25610:129-788(-)